MKVHPVFLGVILASILMVGITFGWLIHQQSTTATPLKNGSIQPEIETAPDKPLERYTIEALRQLPASNAKIVVASEPLFSDKTHTIYTYTAQTLGRSMSGVVNVPTEVLPDTPIIVMLRGWVPPGTYTPGTGTKNAAAALAAAGFITIAPDFFGYATSDPEPADSWQGRFEKPLVVIELINALSTDGLSLPGNEVKPKSIGMWGHSNGGQIALSTLAITKQSIPTTLWAPVTAPFPYNLLYFSDEEADEGRSTRKWIALFDETYDSRQFSFTNYLDGLRGPLQIHQGTNDDAVLKWWSDEFVQKLERENMRRDTEIKRLKKNLLPSTEASTAESQSSTEAATRLGDLTTNGRNNLDTIGPTSIEETIANASSSPLERINYDYYVYKDANHNLTPGWDTVIARDIDFFNKYLQ